MARKKKENKYYASCIKLIDSNWNRRKNKCNPKLIRDLYFNLIEQEICFYLAF